MEMTAVKSEEKLIVSLSGEIDHHSAKDIRDGIDRLIVENAPKILVMDLEGIDFMDSSGLGLVLGRYRQAKELSCDMQIYTTNPRIKKILCFAGVDKLIRIIDKSPF